MHNLRAAGNQHVDMCSTLSNEFHVVHALLFMYKALIRPHLILKTL